MKVFVSDRLDAKALDRVRAAGHEVIEKTGLQGAQLAAALQGCQAILIRGATRVTGEVLRGAPSLKVVVRAGTGLDNVDTVAARQRGIAVFNTPAANAISVAELVFAMLLALERHLVPASTDLQQRGHWEKSKYQGRELCGRHIGLVGFGRIGREVASRANAFGMAVSASDPLLTTWPTGFDHVRRATLDELLTEADIVSMHLPLTNESRGLIGAKELARMKPDAIVVNAARGGVVDENALLAALEAGRPRAACLDVFAVEPPGEHALLKHPRVLAAPHLGASTLEAQRRAGDEAATIVIEALAALQG
jgi:D-3-phosphoglycerate dehydrogenase